MQLTIEEIRELAAVNMSKSHSFEIGASYLIRTVTLHYTGRLVDVTDSDIRLECAAWIADTGRYSECLAEGTLNEIEPYPNGVCISRDCIVDFAQWPHPLPREVK